MKSISVLAVLLISLIIMAQATPVTEKRSEKIGPNLHTLGVRFKDLYASIATSLIETNSIYDKLTGSLHDAVVEAAKKDKVSPPKFFDDWNEVYVALVANSKEASVKLFEKAESFQKKLDEAKH